MRKYSDVIRHARQRIKNEEETYICLAIANVTSHDDRYLPLIKWIGGLLGKDEEGQRTYSEWVRDFHPEFFNENGLDMYSYKFKEGRLQWMDWMVAFWEEKGN